MANVCLFLIMFLCGLLMLTEGDSLYDPSPCPPGYFYCSSACLPLSARCDGLYDCDDQSDEHGCSSQCSFTLQNFYGVFSTPGYPGPVPYPVPSSCRWIIDSGDGRGLYLKFSALQLLNSDALVVYEGGPGVSLHILRALDHQSNGKAVTVESVGGRVMVVYHYSSDALRFPGLDSSVTHSSSSKFPRSDFPVSARKVDHGHGPQTPDLFDSFLSRSRFSPSNNPSLWDSGLSFRTRGFNATYRVRGYCLPWDHPCGSSPGLLWDAGTEEGGGCFTDAQQCDGSWDCANGRDEINCTICPEGHFPCASGRACYPIGERCNYQTSCQDGTDEKGCLGCQPGGFHCDLERCVYEAWVCDGQADCRDGSDERDCGYILPRKVIAAAIIGSLICATLLVVALGCTCRLYTTRAREYSVFAPLSRVDAELIQQQAPPSYGQLIAQGAIPPVENFPTESPSDGSFIGNIRSLLQLLNQTPTPPTGGINDIPTRRRHPRPVRRLLRRLRRWGLIPPRTQGSQTEPTLNQTSSSTEGASDGSDPHSAPLLPVKSSMSLQDPLTSQTTQTEATWQHTASSDVGRGLMGMMQAVRGRILYPLGGEDTMGRDEESGNVLDRQEDEDDLLLLPLAEGFDGAAGDVGLIAC
ncbi:low-density lipoprotein receptor-related protein 10 [Bombina bombina]|uniref:low-density lipoprotein receptor-related protein 10 n=1 Tax=Bombina bombina TaxID=8345 RepID=UPI00235B0355|nr:low-density lipoprotein receptor-related protein 10 [Bombina bombina]